MLIPRVVGQEFESPEAVDAALRAGVRGNRFARAALETAAWDLEAAPAEHRARGAAGRAARREPGRSVPCGVALGIPVDRSAETLRRWIDEAVAARVPAGEDQGRARLGRTSRCARRAQVLAGTRLPLTVDANGGYEWPEHERELRALDEAELLYIEQPLHPDELVGHARLAKRLRTQVCLDETLRDARAARQVAELGGPLVWNVKVHRVGGLSEVCRYRPHRPRVRRRALGRDDARVGSRLPGGARGGGAAGVRLSLGSGAQRPLVRPQCRRHQARR